MQSQSVLAPQLSHYQSFGKLGMHWLPYVMYFNQPNHRDPVINTDSAGYRFSHGDTRRYSAADDLPEGEVNLLMGGSSAFGFGSGCDQTTLASLLSRGTDAVPWLNLAATAFNSTQEVLLFMLNRPRLPKVRNILVYSGLNNLVVAGLAGAADGYGQFFFSGDFNDALNDGSSARTPVSHTLGRLRTRPGLWSRLAGSLGLSPRDTSQPPAECSDADRISIATRMFATDLDRLLEMAAPTGAKVHFALQPTLAWTGKRRSPEEIAFVEGRDELWTALWRSFEPAFPDAVYEPYRRSVADECKRRDVPFLDVSASLRVSPVVDEWLFIDPVHLNDAGTEMVLKILQRELPLR